MESDGALGRFVRKRRRQSTEAWMTVKKNRWDGAAQDYFVDEMFQAREREGGWGVVEFSTERWGVGGVNLGQCPDSEHQRPCVPGWSVSALWQERWDHNTEFFHHQTLPISSEEYPTLSLPPLPPPLPPWHTRQSETEERNALVTIRRAHGMGPEALSAASSTLSVELRSSLQVLSISKVDVQ